MKRVGPFESIFEAAVWTLFMVALIGYVLSEVIK